MKRKRPNFGNKTPPPRQKRRKLNACATVTCNCEKHHHFRLVKFLKDYRTKYQIPFYASLMPYHEVCHPRRFGIRIGDPDFLVLCRYPRGDGKDYLGVYIELKVSGGTLTPAEIEIGKKILEKDDFLFGVCFGWEAAKKLIMAVRKQRPRDVVEKLCWAGPVKKVSLC